MNGPRLKATVRKNGECESQIWDQTLGQARPDEIHVGISFKLIYTVEPPNRGHFGTAAFVLRSEVVLFSEVV